MRRPPGDRARTEQLLREAFASRAAAVHVEADYASLERRIRRWQRARERRSHLGLAAVVVLLAGVVGGVVASFVPSVPPQSALYTSSSGNQGGPLPRGATRSGAGKTTPGSSTSRATAGRVEQGLADYGAMGGQPVTIARTTSTGVRLSATGRWAPRVSVTSGLSSSCYGYEVVSTSVSAKGASAGAIGVVGLQSLGPDGLEVVNSGSVAYSSSRALWWATIAVGPAVARVAAEEPGGSTDATQPTAGLAVIGGRARPAEVGRFFSVVAESASGRPLHSVGFLADWGPTLVGSVASGSSPRASGAGCGAASASSLATSSGSQPAAPLLAASSVLAAFHQAWTPSGGAWLKERLSTVLDGGGLLSAKGAKSAASVPVPSPAAVPGASVALGRVDVSRVQFAAADRATVVYRLDGGPWQTGTAVLGQTGKWLLSRRTFCSGLLDSASPLAWAPPRVVTACGR